LLDRGGRGRAPGRRRADALRRSHGVVAIAIEKPEIEERVALNSEF
jgi:hypothetical protein